MFCNIKILHWATPETSSVQKRGADGYIMHFMYKNAVFDDFDRANVQIKHQNNIQWLMKVISGHKNFTSGLTMSLMVSPKSLPVQFESLLGPLKYI